MLDTHTLVHPQTAPRTISHYGVPVREDVAFTNRKGEESGSVRKRCDKAIEKFQDILRRVMLPDENVLYIARVHSSRGQIEQLMAGWAVRSILVRTLVFTNRRMISLNTNSRGAWAYSIRVVAWGDVTGSTVSGWIDRRLVLHYGDGTKETYLSVPGAAARKLKELLPMLRVNSQGETTPTQGMVSLCPRCLAQLRPQVYECPGCRLVFRNERSLLWRTIIIPGGAFFYTRHNLIGLLFLIGETGCLLEIFTSLTKALTPGPGQQEALIVVAFYAFIYAIETAVVYMHTRQLVREFIPDQPLGIS